MSQRPSKFTPERVQQIKDLVARGVSCEEIATLVGVTVGTLKVTCSRLGISLRKPRSRTGLLPLRVRPSQRHAAQRRDWLAEAVGFETVHLDLNVIEPHSFTRGQMEPNAAPTRDQQQHPKALRLQIANSLVKVVVEQGA
jgi:hypothetical protein